MLFLKEELQELKENNNKMRKECEELEKRLRITKVKGKKNLILNISYQYQYQIQLFITIWSIIALLCANRPH